MAEKQERIALTGRPHLSIETAAKHGGKRRGPDAKAGFRCAIRAEDLTK